MKRAQIQAVRGMNDVLPEESPLWEFCEATVAAVLRQYGYRSIRTPIVERTELFVRGVGPVTDIVEKEMYSFADGDENLSLRPEGTAPTVRAAIEHNLLYDGGPQRLWYSGPLFRHERPQKGRYRQYHTFGVEALGFAGPDIDIELLLIARRLWQRLAIDAQLQINTIGSTEERARFREKLIAYFERHQASLDADSQRRLHSNPLRILDSKNPALQELIEAAPRLIDAIGDESRANFEAVQAGLRDAGIAYAINPRLVRGLDYYNLTVFEWVSERLGAQNAICSGGRYDGLFEQLGGKPTPGCGFGIGVERTLLLLAEEARRMSAVPDAYLVHQGDAASRVASGVAEQLRDRRLDVVFNCGGGAFKSQMKKADASGARFAVIIGEDEVRARQVSVKALRKGGEQVHCSVDQAVTLISTK